jgi:hypothetical protein
MRRLVRAGSCLLWAALAVSFPLLTTPAHSQQRQALQTHVSAPASARVVGRMPSSQRLSLALTLPLRNQEQLQALLQQLDDPTNPKYHQYLTVQQFTEQFGPTVVDYQRVIGFAMSHGFRVTHKSPNRMLVDVSGSVANIEQAFQVKMQVYQHPTENRTFHAPDVEPTVDPGLPVLGVGGLTNFALPHPADLRRFPLDGVHANTTGSGQGGLFLGSDIRAAYAPGVTLDASGQSLALAEFGPWNMSDVQLYFTTVGQPLNVPIVTELLNGVSGICSGTPPSGCDDGEEVIDIEQQISMAPNASVMIVYESYGTSHDDLDIFNAYATDNVAKVMSFSFGIPDNNAASDEAIFAEFHAQGQNLFIASGDAGATIGGNGWPAYSSNVTDVGGTNLTTNGPGGTWLSETGWIGSGGGWCDNTCATNSLNLIPSYQSPVINGSNGGSNKYRDIPDVAAEANTDNFFCGNGGCGGVGGTSLAAPRFAGFVALANQQAAANGETVGFLNTTVYTIGQGSSYTTVFHDITSGNNANGVACTVGTLGCLPSGIEGFNAVTGYDLVTGWGTPNGQGMINALAPVLVGQPNFTLSASPSTVNLTPGASGTSTISLTPTNGFGGTVALTATVLDAPTGVTASFNPASITGATTSTLTVSTTSSSPGGNLILVVKGTSGGVTQTAYVTLALPDFVLSSAPNNIYVNQSATANSTIAVTPENGFAGTVTLSPVSGLPGGVTGSFNPTSTASTSTLTLTASSTAATGPGTPLTITGTSGSITQNLTTVTVSVNAATGTGGSGTPVDLSSAYNLNGIYTDGTTFTTGLDGLGSAYSSNLLTANRILNGVQFNFGPANKLDAVSGAGQAITLPAGQFTTLQLLATSFNGPVLSQTITVTYTDNTTSAFTQGFSDWCGCSTNPGKQSGETFGVTMPYRDLSTGAQDDRPFNLYGYTFVLNSAKTVKSLTLPNNRDIVVLAATLTTQSLGTQVGLSSAYNVAGLYNNGITFPANGGMDGGGNACTLTGGCADGYSAQQLGLPSTTPPALTIKGVLFNFGTVNTKTCTTSCVVDMINLNPGVTLDLPPGQQTAYTTLSMLGTGVQGSHTATVTVNYTTGLAQTFNQTFSDWCSFGNNPNESVAVGGMDRINSDGTLQTNTTCNLYSYTYTLDSTRVVQSIALKNTDGTNFSLVLALTLSGNTASAPGYTLSAAPSTLNVAQGGNNTSTITVNPTGGFAGTVTLAASGLPAGVTASFNTNPATTTSTLTVTASSSASTGGPTTVTVTGSSGTLPPQTATIAVTVTPPASYSLSAGTASPASISPGGSSTAAVTVTPANGYTGTVTLTCAVASTVTFTPAQASCSFSMNPVSVTSGNPVVSTMTFKTVGPSGALLRHANVFYALWLPVPGLALIGLGLGSAGSRRKEILGVLLLWIVLATLIVLPACGSGSSSGGGGGGNPGTPAGMYMLTITGKDANGLTQSNTAPTVSITVN